MFVANYFPSRYYADRYFPSVGEDPPVRDVYRKLQVNASSEDRNLIVLEGGNYKTIAATGGSKTITVNVDAT